MGQLLIKRTTSNLSIDELSSLAYGELGLCQNKLYFGDSNNNNVEVALAKNVQLLTSTPLSNPSMRRINGMVMPVQYDRDGKLSVCIPYISDTPANSKKIPFYSNQWVKISDNNFKLQINTGFKDINYAADIVELLQDNVTVQNIECVKHRLDDESGILYLYSTYCFNGYAILTSGGDSVFYGNELPDVRYIWLKPDRITRAASFKTITITGRLKVELIGKNILAGDVIELCTKRLQTSDDKDHTYRFRPIFQCELTAELLTSRLVEVPFACRVDKLLRYAKCPQSDGYQMRHYYPLYLRIKRSEVDGHNTYYSIPIQLHPNYTKYQIVNENNITKPVGGWFSLV